MRAIDYANELRDTKTEQLIATQLCKLPEKDRYGFIVDMLDICLPVALDLANKCLKEKDSYVRLLEVGLARVRDLSEIKWWLDAIVPRLGAKGVIEIMHDNLDTFTFGVKSAIYFLPMYLDGSNENTKRAFDKLCEAVDDKSRMSSTKT